MFRIPISTSRPFCSAASLEGLSSPVVPYRSARPLGDQEIATLCVVPICCAGGIAIMHADARPKDI